MYKKFIQCDCGSLEHLASISWFEEYDYLYFQYHLAPQVWYKRIWLAIKYIFGYKSKHGHFGETILSQQDVAYLVDTLVAFQNKEII